MDFHFAFGLFCLQSFFVQSNCILLDDNHIGRGAGYHFSDNYTSR